MPRNYTTVTKHGTAIIAATKGSRPATGGNKNVRATGSPTGSPLSKVASMGRANIKGPFFK